MGSKCKHDVHFCVIDTLYTWHLGYLIQYSWYCCVLTVTHHHLGSGVEFSTGGVMLVLKSLRFWSILDFQIRDVLPVLV